MAQALHLAGCSNCPRAKFGCIIVDEETNSVRAMGYNGGPRGGSELCGVDCCERTRLGIPTGTQTQIGCSHAECNAVCAAARNGIKLDGCVAFVTGESCLMCSKILHQAGIRKLYVIKGQYECQEGINYMVTNKVEVEFL